MCFMTSLQFCDMNDINTNKNFSQKYILGFISMIFAINICSNQYWLIIYQMFTNYDYLNFDIVFSMRALLLSIHSTIDNFIT